MTMKDRGQKEKALRLSAAKRWFAQMEVAVLPNRVSESPVLVTDLDVYASWPDDIGRVRGLVFDCKTRSKESAVNRALWLRGVLDRVRAEAGIAILKKEAIALDHRLLASSLDVVLIAEDEFDLYASAIAHEYLTTTASVALCDAWDKYFDVFARYPALARLRDFVQGGYWAVAAAPEACRQTLAVLHTVRGELDPAKDEHLAVILDITALFARSLAITAGEIFRSYFQPAKQMDLSEALLMLLYGGRDAYEHRNELYKRLKAQIGPGGTSELSLPEWDRFVQLTRQFLDAPVDAHRTSLILRETAFATLRGDADNHFAKQLAREVPQAARFALLVTDYFVRASRVSGDFRTRIDSVLIPLQPIR